MYVCYMKWLLQFLPLPLSDKEIHDTIQTKKNPKHLSIYVQNLYVAADFTSKHGK